MLTLNVSVLGCQALILLFPINYTGKITFITYEQDNSFLDHGIRQ